MRKTNAIEKVKSGKILKILSASLRVRLNTLFTLTFQFPNYKNKKKS
jgi:hypothetical protein